ncbi:MAG: VOC family protein [Dehalococcoidia bacterium]
MQKITPFLWFQVPVDEPVRFYVSLFPDAKVIGDDSAISTVQALSFELSGVTYTAFNGGPHADFNDAFSLFVECEDQAEVDRYWDAFIANGGTPSQCGWLQDKWGLRWQIVPAALGECLGDPDPVKAERALQAMLGMQKLDVAALYAARDGTA